MIMSINLNKNIPNDHLPEATEKKIRPQKTIRLLFECLKDTYALYFDQDLD
jgi:hypothetical protein